MLTKNGLEYIYQAVIRYKPLYIILLDSEAAECSFPGYTRKSVLPETAKIDLDGYVYFDNIIFTLDSPLSSTYKVYGSAIIDAEGTILEIDMFKDPLPLKWSGDLIKVTKRLQFDIIS